MSDNGKHKGHQSAASTEKTHKGPYIGGGLTPIEKPDVVTFDEQVPPQPSPTPTPTPTPPKKG